MNSDVSARLEPADERLQALGSELLPIVLGVLVARVEIGRGLIVLLSSFRFRLMLVLFTSQLSYVEDLHRTMVRSRAEGAGRGIQTLTCGKWNRAEKWNA